MSSAARTIWALSAVALALWLFFAALPTLATALKQYPVDGYADWLAARSFAANQDPFSPAGLAANHETTYGHPPTTLLWFLPLLRFNVAELSLPLGLFMLLLLFLHTQLLAGELQFPAALATGALGFALMCTTMCINSHLHAGQVSELIAFLYVMSWYFLRRKNDVAAGAMIGLAATIKLFPGIMVIYFALQRKWRALAAAAISYALLAGAVTIRLGWRAWLEFFTLQGPTADHWMGKIQNASLHGVVLRWFQPSCNEAPSATTPLATLLVAAIGCALIWGAWRLTRRSPIDLSFAIFSLLSIFLNPWVWEHYNVFLLLPLAVALAELRRCDPRASTFVVGAVVLGAAWLLSLDTSFGALQGLLWANHVQHTTASHLQLHLIEVGNWAPAVLLMGALGWLGGTRAGNG